MASFYQAVTLSDKSIYVLTDRVTYKQTCQYQLRFEGI